MNLEPLILHPTTQVALEALFAEPPHGLLLTGPTGFGKRYIAASWAQQFGRNTDIRIVEPDEKQTITIEAVRHLYRESRGRHAGRQMIIIHNAHAMGIEAQNAFLKLLEEPPTGVTFILTTDNTENLLPTIRSRTQHIALLPPQASLLRRLALANRPAIADQDLTQLLFVANGRPATVVHLSANPEQLEAARQRMQQAKALLSASPYERYMAIGKLNDRQECFGILEAMAQMVQAQLLRAQDTAARQHWISTAERLQTTLQSIKQNGNVKAQLLALFAV